MLSTQPRYGEISEMETLTEDNFFPEFDDVDYEDENPIDV